MFEHPATDFARCNFSSDLIGSESMQFGVPHDASHATLPNSAFSGTLSHWLPSLWSRVVVVGQLTCCACIGNPFLESGAKFPRFSESLALGVSHDI